MSKSKSKFSWKNISLQSKIFICVVFSIVCFCALCFGYFIPTMKNSLIEQREIELKDIVDTGISVLNKLNDDVEKGVMKTEEAQETAIAMIKNMRYGSEGKDYLWINDFRPYMIAHPFRHDLRAKMFPIIPIRRESACSLKWCRSAKGPGRVLFITYGNGRIMRRSWYLKYHTLKPLNPGSGLLVQVYILKMLRRNSGYHFKNDNNICLSFSCNRLHIIYCFQGNIEAFGKDTGVCQKT